MPRKYKHNLGGWKKCVSTLLYIVAFNTTCFFIYYTLYLANKQAYLDYYYPPPSPQDFIRPPSSPVLPISPVSEPIDTTPNINTNTDSNIDVEQCTMDDESCNDDYLLSNSKYNVDLHNDPSKYLLLSSLFKTLDNTEICQFFASKQKSRINWRWNDDYKSKNGTIYCLTYNDGGYSYNFLDKLLSNIFQVSYQILDINHIIHKQHQCPNIGPKDKLILLLRDPFDAISMHFWLYELMKSSSKIDSELLPLSNIWCNVEMFNTLNARNEAKKWKRIIEYVLNNYLSNFGNKNILMLQMENLISKSNEDEDKLLTVLEQYFKIGNFLFNGDETKINDNKFAWITKIICELEANKRLLNIIKIPLENTVESDKFNCDIWNIVQNYASLYQYFPSTYNCI